MTAKDILEAKERISQSMKEMEHEIVSMPGRKHIVYAGCVNSDLTEGRGVTLERDYFWTMEEALASVKGQDVMGSNGTARPRTVIVGGDQKFYLVEREVEIFENPEVRRLVALRNKLQETFTLEERILLGIDK